MPKVIPADEWEVISEVVNRHAAGVGADGIRNELPFPVETRTLQRRLSRLEKDRRIRSTGTGKGKRYHPVFPFADKPMPGAIVASPESTYGTYNTNSLVTLGESAGEIRAQVRQHLAHRLPVGYDPGFLGAYIPDETHYLPRETREELGALGHVGVTDLPAGTYLRQVLDRLLIDLSWNSSRLEGNTYSLLETERLLQCGENGEGHRVEETQMILNHKAAIEMLADQAGEIGFNRYTICNLHALLADNLLQDPDACGRVRGRAVGISGSVYHPLEVPQRIEEEFLGILGKAAAITDPYEQAFFAMVHLPYLQPFEDVNKRVSRLAANIPLVRHNLCPLSFVDGPKDEYVNGLIGVYELNRVEYLRDVFAWAYRRSAARYAAVLQSLGEPDPFRLRHRTRIREAVHSVVTGGMGKREAVKWIARTAWTAVPEHERARFIEVVETELSALHEGNIARYRLRPGEFHAWTKGWI